MDANQPFASCSGCVGLLMETIGMIVLSLALIVGGVICPLTGCKLPF